MQLHDQANHDGGPVPLRVTCRACPPDPLARFRFAGDDPRDGDLLTDQRWLGGDCGHECWDAGAPVARGTTDDIAWAATDELLLLSFAATNHDADDPAAVTEDAYRRLIGFAREAGYPWLLRLWNFIPQINRGEGDGERYRRFCLGRNVALEEAGIAQSELCAATAVGTHGKRLLIHMLAGRRRGVPVENPRQVAAYHYPRIYGPRSPSFARALGLPLADGGQALFVSGTASIVGHRTLHPGEVMPQVDETLLNLEALLGAAAERLGKPDLAGFNGDSLLRVYLRHPEHWDAVAERIRSTWPSALLAGLEADICRSDLCVEIEAFHRA